MSKIGRNAPCPCGSGKKYKKCCLSRHEQEAAARRSLPEDVWIDEDDDLDELSNLALDLIAQKRFDEADQVCAQLRDDYPEVVDGIWRQAMVHEARGNAREAAVAYRQAAAFAREHEGFDEDGIQEWLEIADRLDPLGPRP